MTEKFSFRLEGIPCCIQAPSLVPLYLAGWRRLLFFNESATFPGITRRRAAEGDCAANPRNFSPFGLHPPLASALTTGRVPVITPKLFEWAVGGNQRFCSLWPNRLPTGLSASFF